LREEFSASVRDELAKRVGFLCSNPGCRHPTSGPRVASEGTVSIGVAAHIAAASAGGPRYDAALSSAERTSTANGIWLCQSCAKLIDSDVGRYTVEKLREWKTDAESAAARALERRTSSYGEIEGVLLEAERLMPDLVAEIRSDVREPALIREFVVLPNRRVIFNTGGKDRWALFEDDHENLQAKMDWLEEMGLVTNVTPRDTPIYRVTNDFYRWLNAS
jgi:hypothetical protein